MTERVVQTMSQHTAIQVFQRQTPHVHVRVSAWHGMHTAKAAAGPHGCAITYGATSVRTSWYFNLEGTARIRINHHLWSHLGFCGACCGFSMYGKGIDIETLRIGPESLSLVNFMPVLWLSFRSRRPVFRLAFF